MLNPSSLLVCILGGLSSIAYIVYHFALLSEYPLNVFSDAQLQYNWSGTLSMIETGLAAGVLILVTTNAAPYLNSNVHTNATAFASVFFGIITIGQIISMSYRINEFWGADGFCNSDKCPTSVWKNAGREINNLEDCAFNNYAVSSDAWLDHESTSTYVIDWSNRSNYEVLNRRLLYDAYKAETLNSRAIKNEADFYLYHDCWYWGCDSVCHERHTYNETQTILSIVFASCCLLCTILLICQSVADTDVLPVPKASKSKDIESPEDEEEAEESPDAEDDEGEFIGDERSGLLSLSSKSTNWSFLKL